MDISYSMAVNIFLLDVLFLEVDDFLDVGVAIIIMISWLRSLVLQSGAHKNGDPERHFNSVPNADADPQCASQTLGGPWG